MGFLLLKMVNVVVWVFGGDLKSLKFKAPWELIEQCYNIDKRFLAENPNHKIVGLNN